MNVADKDSAGRDASTDDGALHPHGSFFGRRKGHKLRAHQAELIEHLLPRLALDIGGESPAELAFLFDPPADGVRLEIGFGGGEHLIAEARAFQNCGFIGCEPYVNGMAKILAQIEASQTANIRLFAGDAAELLAWAPPRSLDRIDLIHPDPWPKRRHWKRRFISDERVKKIARVIRKGGSVRFATDIPHYGEWALIRFLRSGSFEWTAERAGRRHEIAARFTEGRGLACAIVVALPAARENHDENEPTP